MHSGAAEHPYMVVDAGDREQENAVAVGRGWRGAGKQVHAEGRPRAQGREGGPPAPVAAWPVRPEPDHAVAATGEHAERAELSGHACGCSGFGGQDAAQGLPASPPGRRLVPPPQRIVSPAAEHRQRA